MPKQLKIKPFAYAVFFYAADEKHLYEKHYGPVKDSHEAEANGNGTWIGREEPKICFHEAAHLVDFMLYNHLRLQKVDLKETTELRSYLLEYVGDELAKYVMQRKASRKKDESDKQT